MLVLHAEFVMLEESSAPVCWAMLTKLDPHLALIAEAALLMVVMFKEADMSVDVVRWFIKSCEQGEQVGVDEGGRLRLAKHRVQTYMLPDGSFHKYKSSGLELANASM